MKVVCALLIMVFVAGCTNSGQVVQHPVPDVLEAQLDAQDEQEAQLPEPPAPPQDSCLGVACPSSVKICPDGAQVLCQNSCTQGVCSTCIPNCNDHQDLCAGVACADSVKRCKDGSDATCANSCALGVCSTCIPTCKSTLEITEIMHNPPGSDSYTEWIEIHNPGLQAVDLAEWTLCGNAILPGYIDHADLQEKGNEGTVLAPDAVALITDGGSGTFVPPSGLMMHVDASSLCGGLTNGEKIITLKGPSLVTASYSSQDGAENNGKSLTWKDGNWIESEPTPGLL